VDPLLELAYDDNTRAPRESGSSGGAVWPVRLATAVVGGASLWAQVMVIRAGLVAFGGNELVVALLFGFWLVAVGLGALTGGAVVGGLRRNADLVLAAAFLVLAAVVYVDFCAARGLRGLVGLPAGQCPLVWQIVVGAALVTAPVAFFVGFAFPFLSEVRRARAAGTGEVYALEAAGSLAAALAATYVFLVWGRDDLLAFAAVAVLLLGAFVLLRDRRPRRYCAGLLLVWCFLGQYDLHVLTGWGDRLRWRGLVGGFRLEATAETPYGNLAVLGRQGQYQLYQDGQLSFAFPDRFAEETAAHVAAAQAPRLERVVLAGGRLGLVRELVKYGLDELWLVTFDPVRTDLLEPRCTEETRRALAREEVQRVAADPRAFVRGLAPASCDLIFLALPEPSSARLNRFYTVEFFREVRRALRPEGVVTFSLEAGIHLQRDTSLYAAKCLRTLGEVFPDPVVTAGGTLRFFAAPRAGVVTTDGELLKRRFAGRGIPTSYFRDLFFTEDEAFRPPMLRFTAERLAERLAEVEPDRDLRPTLFLRHLLLFAQTASSSLEGVIRWILALRWWLLLPPALLPGVLVFFLRRRRMGPVVVAVWGTGLWGMALGLVVLFTFQVASGSLYHKVGMVTGAFMCGLSFGALGGRRVRRSRAAVLLAEGSAVLGAAATPGIAAVAFAWGGAGAELLLYGWAALAGLVTGFEFSAANVTLTGAVSPAGASSRVAAVTDGADHLGACIGAVVTGLVLLPSLGTAGTAAFLALMKLGTLVAVGYGWARRGAEQ
jgi:spermidine synthase